MAPRALRLLLLLDENPPPSSSPPTGGGEPSPYGQGENVLLLFKDS